MGIIKKIKEASKYQKTYELGLLQTRAQRILKQHTAKILAPYNISSIHWAMLGILYESPLGLRLKTIADELGVEAPFVTHMIAELSKLGFLKGIQDEDDSRAKLACLTPQGKVFVEETEGIVRKEMKSLVKDVSSLELVTYVHVLKKIIENRDRE